MKSIPGKRKHYSTDIVSLPRALSKLGYCSRSQGIRLVESGRVRVNGEREDDPGRRVSVVHDRISVDDSAVGTKKKLLTICMNKPRGVVTTRSDERGAATVYDVLGEQSSWVFPVGRLDKESSGLLLFTNDADFAEKVTDPRLGHTKSYTVRVDRPLGDEDLQRLRAGIVLNDGVRTRPANVQRLKGSPDGRSFTITITEGKNRQIRRMCRELGFEVLELHRFAIGRLTIGRLAPGEWKVLTDQEKKRVLAP